MNRIVCGCKYMLKDKLGGKGSYCIVEDISSGGLIKVGIYDKFGNYCYPDLYLEGRSDIKNYVHHPTHSFWNNFYSISDIRKEKLKKIGL